MSKTVVNVQGKEHKNFGPNASRLGVSVDAKCFERGQDDEDGRPPMVKRERQMYKYFVTGISRYMVLLHDIVDVLWDNM